MEPFIYNLNPTGQALEVMVYVIALTQLLKDPVKYLLPKAFHKTALFFVSSSSGALLNWLLYTYSGSLWLEGLILGGFASGGFKTVKELVSHVGAKAAGEPPAIFVAGKKRK